MAAREPAQREPPATPRAMKLDSFERVVRAGGIETAAAPQPGAQRELVETNQELGDDAHCCLTLPHLSSAPARNSAFVAPRARGRALTTRSTAGRLRWFKRKDSRMTRRMRLRSTEPPASFAATAMPRRGWPSLFWRAVTAKNPFPMRRPRACTASNSGFRRKRRCAGKVSRPVGSRPELKDLVPWRHGSRPLGSTRAGTLSYGMSFLRPLERRRLNTLRPLRVAMRARKPCVRLRRTLLG